MKYSYIKNPAAKHVPGNSDWSFRRLTNSPSRFTKGSVAREFRHGEEKADRDDAQTTTNTTSYRQFELEAEHCFQLKIFTTQLTS